MPQLRRITLGLIVTVTTSLVVVALPARAQEPPASTDPPASTEPPPAEQPPAEEPPPEELPPEEPVIVIPDLTPHVRVLLAQLGVVEADAQLAATGSVLGQADATVAAATAERDAVQAKVDSFGRSVKSLAVQAYTDGGNEDLEDAADPDLAIPGGPSSVVFGTVQTRLLEQLRMAREELQGKQAALDSTIAAREAAAAAQAQAQADAERARAGLDAATARTGGVDLSPSVMGASVMTAEEIVGWFQAQPPVVWAGTVDLPTMAKLFIDEAATEGVRGDVAFAQAMVETGAFTSRLTSLNNFSGIGACDSCADGWHFESAAQGVRVQMQLLHAYAEPATLGFGQGLIVTSFNDLGVKGCCPTYQRLTGVWATDPNYGLKIMQIYNSMLTWAAAARGIPVA